MPELNIVIIKCNHNQIKRQSENCDYIYVVIAASLVGQKILSKNVQIRLFFIFFCVCREDTCTAVLFIPRLPVQERKASAEAERDLGPLTASLT